MINWIKELEKRINDIDRRLRIMEYVNLNSRFTSRHRRVYK